jgi:hypothetical protein
LLDKEVFCWMLHPTLVHAADQAQAIPWRDFIRVANIMTRHGTATLTLIHLKNVHKRTKFDLNNKALPMHYLGSILWLKGKEICFDKV